MVNVYDKATWHIDGGEDEKEVVERFKLIYVFLNSKELLNNEGKEVFRYGIDDSISLHDGLVIDKGKKLLDVVFDDILTLNINEINNMLEEAYKKIK